MNVGTAFAIARKLGWQEDQLEFRPVSGGSVAASWRLECSSGRAFVKTMPVSQAALLDAERDGLKRLARAGRIRTPAILGNDRIGDLAWLALEWLELEALSADAGAALGRQLVDLHHCRAETFGLGSDNFIGAMPQRNTQTADWTEFLFEHRLGFQLERLAENRPDFGTGLKHRLRDAWHGRFADYAPAPSLLHGDLWAGNAGRLRDGKPVLFDPAVHYGDRECDLAMADLFGGFGAAFFDAYAERWPLEHGWRLRRRFYQLYHLLNHANLFGGHYVSASVRLIEELSA